MIAGVMAVKTSSKAETSSWDANVGVMGGWSSFRANLLQSISRKKGCLDMASKEIRVLGLRRSSYIKLLYLQDEVFGGRGE